MDCPWIILCGIGLLLTLSAQVKGQCTGHADLVIAVPGSLLLTAHEFAVYEDNLINLLRYFNVEPDQFNIGLILYGERAVPIAWPQPYKTRTQINTRVTLLSQRATHLHSLGLTNDVAAAINAIQKMFNTAPPGYAGQILRQSARKIGLVFTYGPSEPANVQRVVDSAMQAKSNFMMYAVAANGTGPDFSRIGSDYCRMFSMGSLADSLHHAVHDIAAGICAEVDPRTVVSSGNCFPKEYSQSLHIGVTCQVQGNMIQPDPNNCAYYYQCEYFDRNPIRNECPVTTLYDPLIRTCNTLNNVACYNDLVCPNDLPMLHAHPLDCNKFLNCYNDRVPHVQACPEGQVFDPVYRTCNQTMGVCIEYN